MVIRWRGALAAMCLALLAACGSGGGGGAPAGSAIPPAPTTANAEINLLFMGNSHTTFNNVPGMVGEMVRAARPAKSVAAVEAPGWLFLGERAQDETSLELLRGGQWTFVVLQAQEYSSSGQFTYPTTGAETLIRLSNQQHATPILFPEWPRRGIDESQRIYSLHV